MSRPTRLHIEPSALLHNVAEVRRFAPHKRIIAMVKANAYGCGIKLCVPVLEGEVDIFGVACMEEALVIRSLGIRTECLLVQGIFSPDELPIAAQNNCSIVLHQPYQLEWLVNTPLHIPIKVWVKIDTGMTRLGFMPDEFHEVMNALTACPWVHKEINLMTHMACADEPERVENIQQAALFNNLHHPGIYQKTMANSAAIISSPKTHADIVRPGIMLYGVSPFANQYALDFGLLPVMHFMSSITAIHRVLPNTSVGYSGLWRSPGKALIGVVSAGYGDGYPRHISPNTPVWVNGNEVPIVGRVSMDMLTIDLTNYPEIQVGDAVELWGAHLPVERIARSAGTIGYELLTQVTDRVRC